MVNGIAFPAPPSCTRKVGLAIGGAVALLIVGVELFAGGALAFGEITSSPIAWWGVAVGVVLGLVGPCAVLADSLTRHHQTLPLHQRIARMELIGANVGVFPALILLVIIGSLSIL